jgi:hypothetical protein
MTALSTATDGALTVAADLTTWASNIDTLCQQTTGRTAAAGASTKPLLKLSRNATQSVANNTTTLINWTTVGVQSGVTWSAGTPTQITIITPGWYAITAQVVWVAGAAASERSVSVFVNGTVVPTNIPTSFLMRMGGVSIGTVRHQVEGYEHLAAGATVYIGCYQNSGSTINLVNTPYGTWCTLTWDAPY